MTMGMSDKIEAFILELMKQEEDEWLKIQRNELAQVFGCVPSQINYVISTRFNSDRGYDVESKRGGGGCVRIRRTPQGITVYVGEAIGEEEADRIISQLYSAKRIGAAEYKIMEAAVSNTALASAFERDKVRAEILKSMLSVL